MATAAVSPAYAGAHEASHSGIWSWLTTVDHKRIGALYMYTALAWFGIGGLEAEIMRWQLKGPNGHVVSAETTWPFGPFSCQRMMRASRPPMPNQARAVYM